MPEPAKVKFRFVEFELSGDDGTVRESVRDLAAAYTGTKVLGDRGQVLGEVSQLLLPEASHPTPNTSHLSPETSHPTPLPGPRRFGKPRPCANPACCELFVPKIDSGPRAQIVCGKFECKKWRVKKRLIARRNGVGPNNPLQSRASTAVERVWKRKNSSNPKEAAAAESADGALICPNPACGAKFVPKIKSGPRMPKVCPKPECKGWWARKKANDSYRAKHKTAGRYKKPDTSHLTPNTSSGRVPAGSEHGAGFSLAELKGLTQTEALLLYARRHKNLLNIPVAVPILQATGLFGNGNAAATRNRLFNHLEGMNQFTATDDALIYGLKE